MLIDFVDSILGVVAKLASAGQWRNSITINVWTVEKFNYHKMNERKAPACQGEDVLSATAEFASRSLTKLCEYTSKTYMVC